MLPNHYSPMFKSRLYIVVVVFCSFSSFGQSHLDYGNDANAWLLVQVYKDRPSISDTCSGIR